MIKDVKNVVDILPSVLTASSFCCSLSYFVYVREGNFAAGTAEIQIEKPTTKM